MTTVVIALIAAAIDPELLDVSEHLATMKVFSDGNGHYLVATKELEHVYYGDGERFFATTPWGMSVERDRIVRTLRDQRYGRMEQTKITTTEAGLTVTCGRRVTDMTHLDDDHARALLVKAVFKRLPQAFEPYVLARDDRGNYYFVERGRFPDNQRAFHVYVGPRGNMKKMELKNVVHDTVGDIFSTPSGDLRLVTSHPATTEWLRGNKRSKLTDVPIEENMLLIYNELGVYNNIRLGTPCDDL